MDTTPRLAHPPSQAVTYRVTLAGHLDDHWSDWLDAHSLVRNDDGSTTLTVEAVDQAQLHGLLTGIRDLGVNLLSLGTLDHQPAALTRTLRTERLTLRPATEDDAEDTWAYRRLDPVNEWLSGAPGILEDYRTMFSEPARLDSTVIVELAPDLGGHIIGDLMLRRENAWAQAEVTERARGAQAELGWALDPAHTGAGYATEAVRELLRYCFVELEVHRVVASCFLDNDASRRLMERLGMRCETHAVAESLHRSGRWLDTVGYAQLADEWSPAPPPR
jgi:RimJ/RimL family protein N-acetyltransferase